MQVIMLVLLLVCGWALWNHGGPSPPPPNPSGCYTKLLPSTNCTSSVAGVTIRSTLGCCAAQAADLRFATTTKNDSTPYKIQVTAAMLQPFGGNGPFEGNVLQRNFYINVPKTAQGKLPFVLLFDSGPNSGSWDFNMDHKDGGVTPSGVSDVMKTVANEYPVVAMGPAFKDHWYNIDKTTTGQGHTFTWDGAPMAPDTANNWNVGLYEGFGKTQDMPFIKYVVNEAMTNPLYHCSGYCVVAAFSAGTAMASRAMQEFPHITDRTVPQIIGAVLNDGASYQCYAYDSSTAGTPPMPFSPCPDASHGCCPNGFTELDYQQDGTHHPPTLVQSPRGENNADPGAAQKYYDALSSVNGKVMQVTPTFPDSIHGLDPSVAPIETKFILQLLDIYK